MRFIQMISFCRPELNPPHSIVKNGNDIFGQFYFDLVLLLLLLLCILCMTMLALLCKIHCSIEKMKKVSHYKLYMFLRNCP